MPNLQTIFKPTKNRRSITEFLSVLFFATCSKYSPSVFEGGILMATITKHKNGKYNCIFRC